MHSAYFGDRHFKLEKVTGGGGSRATRRFTRVDFVVGLIEDIKWVHVTKQGKSFQRLFLALLDSVFSGLMLALPIVLGLAQIQCRTALNLEEVYYAGFETSDISRMLAGNLTANEIIWCEQFKHAPDKLGRPCVCRVVPGVAHQVCHTGLDPSQWHANKDAWCYEFDHGSIEVTDMVPCECMTFAQQHLPSWDLLLLLWSVFSTNYSTTSGHVGLLYSSDWRTGGTGRQFETAGALCEFSNQQKVPLRICLRSTKCARCHQQNRGNQE